MWLIFVSFYVFGGPEINLYDFSLLGSKLEIHDFSCLLGGPMSKVYTRIVVVSLLIGSLASIYLLRTAKQ